MQEILNKTYKRIKSDLGKGKVADYIPELAKVNPKQFAMSLVTIHGEEYNVGCFDKRFSIQSISKVIVLAMAMEIVKEKLWQRVGREPSGSAFNSLVQLESEDGKPRNPFINAGAIVTTDVVVESCLDPYKLILDFVRKNSKSYDVNFDKAVVKSEALYAQRNTALAYFMQSFGNLNSNVKKVLDVYFHHCSLAMSTLELSRLFLFLANKGINPLTDTKVMNPRYVKRINAIMMTCGLYDSAGDFAYRVGLPAKSGVGGGIVSILPGEFVLSVWSPSLNHSGNSYIGTKALEQFSRLSGKSIF